MTAVIISFMKSLPLLITSGGSWCIVAILLLVIIGYHFHNKTVNELKKKMCPNNNCKFKTFIQIRSNMLAKVNIIINDIKDTYSESLVNFNNIKNEHTHEQIENIVVHHSNLIDSLFLTYKKSLNDIFIQNNVPDPNSSEFDEFIIDKFESLWSSVWVVFKMKYSKQQYLLDLDDRIFINLQKKKLFMQSFKELFIRFYKLSHK